MSVSFSTIIQKARPNPVAATSNALREAIAKIPQAHLSKLANGVRVTSEPNPHAKFATVGIWLEAGTKWDQRHTQGLSKVLQTAGFYGTTTQDRAQIVRAVDELGGQLIVETGREASFVALKVAKENVPRAVGLLADVIRNARLNDGDVEAAKKEVETVRHQSEELVDDLVFDNLHICAYDASENGSLGNSINGTKEGIKAVNAEELKTYRKNIYTGPRTLLVATGAVDHKELETLAQQYLGDMSDKDVAPAVDTRFVGGDIRLWNQKMSLGHMAWAVETSGAMSGDTTALQLATQMHGNWHRSQHELGNHAIQRMFKVYSALDFGAPNAGTQFPEKAPELTTTFFHQYQETGLLGGYVVGRQAKTSDKAARSTSEMFENSISDYGRMAMKAIEDNEFEQAKVNLKAQLLFNVDGSVNTAKDLARQTMLFGRRVTLEEAYARIDDVSQANLQEVLQHYFLNRKPVMSMYGYFYPSFSYITLTNYLHKVFY